MNIMLKKLLAHTLLAAVFTSLASLSLAQARTAEKAFEYRDSNGDGKVTVDEFVAIFPTDKQPMAKKWFKNWDKDNDGTINFAEFKPRWEKNNKKYER